MTRGVADRGWSVALLAALASSLALLGLAPVALPPSYSWVELGLSEAAGQGVAGAWVARTGFVVFGLSVLGIGVLSHRSWRAVATGLHGGFAVGMILVAVFSHAPWEAGVPFVELEDRLHSVFASVVGFSFIAGVAATFALSRPRGRWAALGDVAALMVAITVPLLMSTSVWGVLQRLMFLTAAAWYAAEVVRHADRSSVDRS